MPRVDHNNNANEEPKMPKPMCIVSHDHVYYAMSDSDPRFDERQIVVSIPRLVHAEPPVPGTTVDHFPITVTIALPTEDGDYINVPTYLIDENVFARLSNREAITNDEIAAILNLAKEN